MIHPKSLRVLIVDDEPLARERLRQLLSAELAIEIIGECVNGEEAVEVIRKESPDLVFLDVQMPELDGFGVLRALNGGRMPAIVFVTAYDQYAMRASEVCAVDYLLKPFDRERFQKALQRAHEKVRRDAELETTRQISDLLDTFEAPRARVERLAVKAAGRVIFVKVDEIDWIRSADNYAELHVEKSVHLIRQTMAVLQEQLPPHQFARISRSVIVNLNRVTELSPRPHGGYLIVLRDGARLTASRNYGNDLQRLLEKSR